MKFIIKRAIDSFLTKKQPTQTSYWDDDVKEWCIDLDGFDDIKSIIDWEGAIVIFPPCGGELYEIVIYDAYLE